MLYFSSAKYSKLQEEVLLKTHLFQAMSLCIEFETKKQLLGHMMRVTRGCVDPTVIERHIDIYFQEKSK